MKRIAILNSQHKEVARVDVNEIEWVYCVAGNPNAKDLLKVITAKQVYRCDELEYIDEGN